MIVKNLKVLLLLTLLNASGWVIGTSIAMISCNGFFGTAREVQSFYFGFPDAIKSIAIVYEPSDQWWWLCYIAAKWLLPVGFLFALFGVVPQWREDIPMMAKVKRPLASTTLLTSLVLIVLSIVGPLQIDYKHLFL